VAITTYRLNYKYLHYEGYALSFAYILDKLALLSNALEHKPSAQFPAHSNSIDEVSANTDVAANENLLHEQSAVRPSPFFSNPIGTIIGVILIPIVLSLFFFVPYLFAKLFGMWGGMICFFVPVLFLAYGTFTRSTESEQEIGMCPLLVSDEMAINRQLQPALAACLSKYGRRYDELFRGTDA
jgi:hypothetical protein